MAYRCVFNNFAKRICLLKSQNLRKIQFTFSSSRSKSKRSFPVKNVVIAVSLLGVSGGVYGYMTTVPERKRNLSNELTELAGSYVLAEPPEIKPSRRVNGPAKEIELDFLLYQYQTCPFCCKVRAFLEYYGFPYDVVEVNPVMRQQIKFSKYKKVPILIAHDRKSDVTHQLKDSSVITSILGTFLISNYDSLSDILKFYLPVSYTDPDGKVVNEVMNQYFLMYGESQHKDKTDDEIQKERKWRRWADQELVHILSPNIYRTREEALQAFNYFSEVGEWEKNFADWERLMVIYVGATAMYFIGKRLKKKYALKDDVRESLYDACRTWMKSIGSANYHGGKSPNLADLAVYGLLSSIEGCITFKDLLKNTRIGPWYYRVQNAVKNHEGYFLMKAK